MKNVILFSAFSLGTFFLSGSISNPLLADCFLCNSGAADGYCHGDAVKACVDTGGWWNNECDLAPACDAGVEYMSLRSEASMHPTHFI